METYVSWVQLSVTALLLALVVGTILKTGSRTREYVDAELRKMKEAMAATETNNKLEYLTKETHDLKCENQGYKLEKHVTKSLDPIFAILRTLEKKIDALDGRTHFLKNGNNRGVES